MDILSLPIEIQFEHLHHLTFEDLNNFCNAKLKIFNNGKEYLDCVTPSSQKCASGFIVTTRCSKDLAIYNSPDDDFRHPILDESSDHPNVVLIHGTALRAEKNELKTVTTFECTDLILNKENNTKMRNSRANVIISKSGEIIIHDYQTNTHRPADPDKVWNASDIIMDMRHTQPRCFRNKLCSGHFYAGVLRRRATDGSELQRSLFATVGTDLEKKDYRLYYELEQHGTDILQLIDDAKKGLNDELTESYSNLKNAYTQKRIFKSSTVIMTSALEFVHDESKGSPGILRWGQLHTVGTPPINYTNNQGLELKFLVNVLRKDVKFDSYDTYTVNGNTSRLISVTDLPSLDNWWTPMFPEDGLIGLDDGTPQSEISIVIDDEGKLTSDSFNSIHNFVQTHGRHPWFFSWNGNVFCNQVRYAEDAEFSIYVKYNQSIEYSDLEETVSRKLYLHFPFESSNLYEFLSKSNEVTPSYPLFEYKYEPFNTDLFRYDELREDTLWIYLVNEYDPDPDPTD